MSSPDAWRIVLIDDEADIREVMSLALRDEGYEVVTAEDGRAGLEACRQFKPRIAITDIRMPKMNGLEVLAALKEQDPDIEVIVMTAFGEMDQAIEALRLDASDFITKPVHDEALELALNRARERYSIRRKDKDYTEFLEKENTETTQELLRTFSYQRNLIDSSMDGILGTDDRDRVVTFNKVMEQISGYTRAEALGIMTLGHFLSPGEESRFRDALGSKKFGGPDRVVLFETQIKSAGGEQIPVQMSAVTLYEGGHVDGLVCFFRDLREIRLLEREMEDQARILQQDKMMSLGRLAASVAHEINNPLSGILNYIRLMIRVLDRGPVDGEQREKFTRYLDLVEKETGRCTRIVSNLLNFSRKSPETFAQVQVSDLLDRCAILSRHKMELQNIELISECAPDLPYIMGDFNQIQQCILNLIFNAIDAMPDGGTLTLAARRNQAGQRIVISVSDTGLGISPDDLPHIFEPFYTTKKEGYGVGLGLSTTYGIMERHQGGVGVDSRPGEGTTFRLEFPV